MIVSGALKGARHNNQGGVIMTLDELIKNWGEGETSTGRAMRLSPVAAAHRVLTNSLGALPVDLYQRVGGARKGVDGHRTLFPLTVRANPNMTPFLFKKCMASAAFWHGEGFAYIDIRSSPMQLLPLPQPTMRMVDEASGARWYAFTVGNMERKFSEGELLHVYFESTDGRRGMGLLEMATESIRTDLAAQAYAGKFYSQGARPFGVVEVPAKLDQPAKDVIRDSFERMTGGMDGAFRIAVIDLGMKYTQLGISQRDAQYIESRGFTVEEIARFTGVPLPKLQAGKQSYSTNEQQGIDYVVATLQPHAVQWEQEFTYKLLTASEAQSGMYYRFNLAAEMRGDNQSRANFYQRMVYSSVYTPNECRAYEEKDSRPGGDELLVTKNLTTLARVIDGSDGGGK